MTVAAILTALARHGGVFAGGALSSILPLVRSELWTAGHALLVATSAGARSHRPSAVAATARWLRPGEP